LLGLQWTTADRAAFLVQLTTILVPVLEATLFSGQPGVKPLTSKAWAACALAALGVVVISADGAGVDFAALTTAALHPSAAAAVAATAPSAAVLAASVTDGTAGAAGAGAAALASPVSGLSLSLRGDALVACSAIAYSFHVLRLGAIAPRTRPLDLAVAKAAAETTYSALTLVLLLGAAPPLTAALGLGTDWLPAHFPPAAALNAFGAAVAAGAVGVGEWKTIAVASLWCGAATCAYTIWAQSFGQRAVRPTAANLIYTSQPIFSAIFAAALLGEKLSPQGACGGAIIIAALLLSLQADPGISSSSAQSEID
jgi:drug/metabolite transporter (DMT)-like permease